MSLLKVIALVLAFTTVTTLGELGFCKDIAILILFVIIIVTLRNVLSYMIL